MYSVRLGFRILLVKMGTICAKREYKWYLVEDGIQGLGSRVEIVGCTGLELAGCPRLEWRQCLRVESLVVLPCLCHRRLRSRGGRLAHAIDHTSDSC